MTNNLLEWQRYSRLPVGSVSSATRDGYVGTQVPPLEAKYVINDGQHRVAGIEEPLKRDSNSPESIRRSARTWVSPSRSGCSGLGL